MVKAYVVSGLGIGCHEETRHAYEKAGVVAEVIHFNQLLDGSINPLNAGILNFSGGFLYGDILGAGMCAANSLEHALVRGGEEEKRLKDLLIEFSEKGGIIYGQCNGFQVLVRTGLLPGIGNDYSSQTVTLTNNKWGPYRVAPVVHIPDMSEADEFRRHFSFDGIDYITLWCRHGEGNLQFHSRYSLISPDDALGNRSEVNASHCLLRYADPNSFKPAIQFPHNPNGSCDGIAGLRNRDGNIFGHMAHTEVGIYRSRSPNFYAWKDRMRRQGIKAGSLDERLLEGAALKVFRNIAKRAKTW